MLLAVGDATYAYFLPFPPSLFLDKSCLSCLRRTWRLHFPRPQSLSQQQQRGGPYDAFIQMQDDAKQSAPEVWHR